MIVVDASALMALLLREPGSDAVAERISESAISTVNLAEVLARMWREQISPRTLVAKLAAPDDHVDGSGAGAMPATSGARARVSV
jgi:PIN domain nuclease of toxin-antitoxin system